jgi:membrane protein implicated in regulation of membrane protease activity
MSLDQAFFLGIALVGALFLLASFVIGEIGDFFDDVGDTVGDAIGIGDTDVGTDTGGDMGDEGPSPLSLRTVMAFLTAYGASGLITSAYGWSTLASSLFAIIPGAVMGLVAYQVMRQLYAQQATSVVEVGGLLGSGGVVDVAIPQAGLGRVTVSTHTGSSTFLARSQDGAAIAHGERVVVRGTMGNELVVARAEPS